MVKVLHLRRGGVDIAVLVLIATQGLRSSSSSLDIGCLRDCYKNYIKSAEILEDTRVRTAHFERSKNYSHRADNFIPTQPKYHRQFGNGGISGRVPYHLKRENYYRSKCK
jgi:hypothetical protein